MTDKQELKRIHAIVSGRVQGVNFRAYTQRKAATLDLTGWVKNMPDQKVKTVAEGTQKALEEFIEFLHEGPPSAQVTEVELTWEEYEGEFDNFKIRYF